MGLASCSHSSSKARNALSTTSTPPSSATTAAPTPTRPPVLGRAWGDATQYQHGYGEVRPSRIDNGGDPTGVVENVRWQSWGGGQAVGSGMSTYLPGKIVADGTQERATIVAFNLATCRRARAFTA